MIEPKDRTQSELFGFEEGILTCAKRGGNSGEFELAQAAPG